MKKTYLTKMLVAINVVAVLAIATIIFLHTFQSQNLSEVSEGGSRPFNNHVESAQFNPMFDPNDKHEEALIALFSKDEPEELETDEESQYDSEQATEEMEEGVSMETEEVYASAVEETTDDSTGKTESNHKSEQNTTSSWKSSSSTSSDSNVSTGAQDVEQESAKKSKTQDKVKPEKTPPPLKCKKTQTQQNGKCVNISYLSLVQSKLPAAYSASSSDPIIITYEGAKLGEIHGGNVSGDGLLESGTISFEGPGQTPERISTVATHLSGLIN